MLVTDEHQVVIGSPDPIIVLPVDRTQIFVPTYDPAAVLAAEPVPLAPMAATAEAPAQPEVAEEPAPAEPESVEAVDEVLSSRSPRSASSFATSACTAGCAAVS
jgi:hypothetical protein